MPDGSRKPIARYSREVADTILAQMSEGQSLRSICEQDGYPSERAVRAWAVKDKHGFADAYACAREMQADAHADMIVDAARDVLEGRLDPNAARVAIDALKWTASKLKPKSYGDRLEANLNVSGGFVGVLASLEQIVTASRRVEPTENPVALANHDGAS